jgi:dolichol-phosphate mannosyltransferase
VTHSPANPVDQPAVAGGSWASRFADRLRAGRVTRQFVKFSMVGGSGVIVNSALLYFLHEWFHVRLLIASPIAVEAAIINNFFWNNQWTFRSASVDLKRFAKFNLVSLGGLAITTGGLYYLTEAHKIHYLIANLIAIGVATIWNFGINFLWTWRVE